MIVSRPPLTGISRPAPADSPPAVGAGPGKARCVECHPPPTCTDAKMHDLRGVEFSFGLKLDEQEKPDLAAFLRSARIPGQPSRSRLPLPEHIPRIDRQVAPGVDASRR